MELIIVRHGTTVWNNKRRTQGRVHNRLSEDGILQSEITAEQLKNTKIDYIFCSPLLRAVQTANIINKYHKKKIIKDELLTDIDQGVFTGRFFDSLTSEELEIKKRKDKNYGMESHYEMYVRVNEFYKYLKEHYKDKTILVVTHSGIASFLSLMTQFDEFNPEIFNRTDFFQNAEMKKFRI